MKQSLAQLCSHSPPSWSCQSSTTLANVSSQTVEQIDMASPLQRGKNEWVTGIWRENGIGHKAGLGRCRLCTRPGGDLMMRSWEGGKGWVGTRLGSLYSRGLQLNPHNSIPACLAWTHSENDSGLWAWALWENRSPDRCSYVPTMPWWLLRAPRLSPVTAERHIALRLTSWKLFKCTNYTTVLWPRLAWIINPTETRQGHL